MPTSRALSNDTELLGAGDTAVLSPAVGERFDVTELDFHNLDTISQSVSVYYSPDATSAAGNIIDTVALGPGESLPSFSGLGGINSGQNLVVVPSATDKVTVKATYDKLTGEAAST